MAKAKASSSVKSAPFEAPEVRFLPPDREVSLKNLDQICERIDTVMADLRVKAIRPSPVKRAPQFTSTQLAELCGIDRPRLNYLLSKGELPAGDLQKSGSSRTFSLGEAQAWVRAMPQFRDKPEDVLGSILVVTMLKGGSTKTTSTMSFAQGLTLLGRKVLVVDLDPQASLSELCGIFIQNEVDVDDSVLRFIHDPENTELLDLVKPTYWESLDVIPAHIGLFDAEFQIPAMLIQDRKFRFFDILRQGLEPLREHYDYILIDTPPSLSYLTINALMAADALIMPIVPESLDALSSLTFWSLLQDFSGPIGKHYGFHKTYDFVSVLLSKVDNNKAGTDAVRHWLQHAYTNWVSPIEIPYSAAMSNSSVVISTVFDLNKSDMNAKTLNRVRDPLFQYCKWLDQVCAEKWARNQSEETTELREIA